MYLNLTENELEKLLNLIDSQFEYKSIEVKINKVLSKISGRKKKSKTEKIEKIVNAPINSLKQAEYSKKFKKIAEDYRQQKIKEQTKEETVTKAILKSLKIPFDFQKIFYNIETFYIVDFYLPDYNVVIEVDGGYHNTKVQKEKDVRREKFIRRYNKVKYIARIRNEDTVDTRGLAIRIKNIIEYSKKKRND